MIIHHTFLKSNQQGRWEIQIFVLVSIKHSTEITKRIIVIGDNSDLIQNGKNRL